jgi:hypothetical protein
LVNWFFNDYLGEPYSDTLCKLEQPGVDRERQAERAGLTEYEEDFWWLSRKGSLRGVDRLALKRRRLELGISDDDAQSVEASWRKDESAFRMYLREVAAGDELGRSEVEGLEQARIDCCISSQEAADIAAAELALVSRPNALLLESARWLALPPVTRFDGGPPSGALHGDWSVCVVDFQVLDGDPSFVIEIRGPRVPRVVGCSLRTPDGRINDLPGRRPRALGRLLWRQALPSERLFQNAQAAHRVYNGEVTFSIWTDEGFTDRLANSGWVAWDTQNPAPLPAMNSATAAQISGFDIEFHANDWDVGPGAEVSIVMDSTEASSHIAQRADVLGWEPAADATKAGPSPAGTLAYVQWGGDGKTALYCHACGPLRALVFSVRGGIGWSYHRHLGGPGGPLGLPVSDEYLADYGARSDFENGHIEWHRAGSVVRAYRATPSGPEIELELPV